MSGKIKVLIVDDSAFIRILLSKALTSTNENISEMLDKALKYLAWQDD